MEKVIQWKQGSKMTGSAEGAYKEVQQIIKREGGATPAAVLDRARNKRSALHRHFDWDDGIAAEKWRIRQAGKLLQSIEIIDMERPAQPVRALSVVTTRPSKSDEPPRNVPVHGGGACRSSDA
jgi:hypothetical protein